jgi:hypothetical protein
MEVTLEAVKLTYRSVAFHTLQQQQCKHQQGHNASHRKKELSPRLPTQQKLLRLHIKHTNATVCASHTVIVCPGDDLGACQTDIQVGGAALCNRSKAHTDPARA